VFVPKDTFFNLPDNKRISICDVAIDEFAEYPFDQASINRIVANSGIAKGSFYQYFEDKKDLFLYIIGLIGEEKINYISPVIRKPEEHDIFTLIKELFLSGIQFAIEHPRYAAIGNNLLTNKDAPIYREMKIDNFPSTLTFFEPLIEEAIARGDVRRDIEITMLNFVITSMNMIVVEYCSEFHPQAIFESMIETVDAFMDILKNGIGDNN
jgi:AcrR family transcriptional regulator